MVLRCLLLLAFSTKICRGKHQFRARCEQERLHLKADESYLVVQVVEVARDKNVNVSHDLQNIQTLKEVQIGYS